MIREKLLEERAKEMSVSATDEEVEEAVARVKAQYNLRPTPSSTRRWRSRA